MNTKPASGMNANRQPSPLLIVISAPSGGGKTTVCSGLLGGDARLARALTCTTRTPRPGERDGVDYYFLTPEMFEQKVAVGEFLEHATVHGHRYGTLKAEVLGKLRQAWMCCSTSMCRERKPSADRPPGMRNCMPRW